jgi:TnpA family transposase
MTDTAGYTDVMFALYRLLGYQYSPASPTPGPGPPPSGA